MAATVTAVLINRNKRKSSNMWIPGLFLGAAAIVFGIVSILKADQLARLFERGSAFIGDRNSDRYTAGRIKVPGAMAIGIGIVGILLSVFGEPVP